MTTLLTALTATAPITSATTPALGTMSRYNATAGALAPPLPALSGLRVGARMVLQKDTLDATANTITFTCAAGDTFDDGTTSVTLSATGQRVDMYVVIVANVKYWKALASAASGGGGGSNEWEQYANLAAFPGTGSSTKEYVAQDTGKLYRWNGSAYVQVGDKNAVGLGNVDNTSDINKPVSTAQAAADASTLTAAEAFATSADSAVLSSANATTAAAQTAAQSFATSADTTVLVTASGRAIAFTIALG